MDETQQALRNAMVREQIASRGVRDEKILEAMRSVPREQFMKESLREFAYQDTPLPIGFDQTISQPFIVAYMIEALALKGGERVLEIGTGSGYAAAVLAEIAGEVYTVERYPNLAETARERLARTGYTNVHVLHGDGTRGWPEHAPYDGIIVAAGGPEVPRSLHEQLRVGGRLVIPVGPQHSQKLVRVTRISESEYHKETLTEVRFVPLVGAEGWEEKTPEPSRKGPLETPEVIAEHAEPFDRLESASLNKLLERIWEAKLVLIGEATHGTSEFYRMRARITRELIEKKGFTIVAAEADWPDARRVDAYVRGIEHPPAEWSAFSRFPTWMWRNEEVREFAAWLAEFNKSIERPYDRVGFYGLDLYSLNTSIAQVLQYLDGVDPETANVARRRYGCLTPWQRDPAAYGYAALTGQYRTCEAEVVRMLQDLLDKRMAYARYGGDDRLMDALQNAQVVANAERYYRTMYYSGANSWNLRDQHMYDTLKTLLEYRGPNARAVVWAHNSHLGDASATEMSARGEFNVGQLCREGYGDAAYLIGFGTHEGTVAAATNWDEPVEIKSVRPSHERSYERLCHDSEVANFLLGLHAPSEVRKRLMKEHLERAIGVIYRPETEIAGHYFRAILPKQFDEYIWFDRTSAVRPLPGPEEAAGTRDETYPFGF